MKAKILIVKRDYSFQNKRTLSERPLVCVKWLKMFRKFLHIVEEMETSGKVVLMFI